MSEREPEEPEATTSPSEDPQDATTPPGSGDRDEDAVERGEEKLDQAGGGH